MEHMVKEWLPVLGENTALGEDVPACCAFLDAVQQGQDLPAVKWSVAPQLQATAFRLAIWNDHVQTVQALLQLYGQRCLHARMEELGVRQLRRRSLLALAATCGATSTAVALVQANANLEAAPLYKAPLAVAVEAGHADTVSALVGLKARLDGPTGPGPLQVAARNGDVALVTLLLRAKAAVNGHDFFGTAALCQAAYEGRSATVALLLREDGVDVNDAGNSGRTPLSLATWNTDVNIMSMLVQAKAAVDLADRDGNTPLSHAVVQDDVLAVAFLLEAGAAVDARNHSGQTPLHAAVERCSVPIASVLLQAKADPNAPDNGEWAFSPFCSPRERYDMQKLLEAHLEARANAGAEVVL